MRLLLTRAEPHALALRITHLHRRTVGRTRHRLGELLREPRAEPRLLRIRRHVRIEIHDEDPDRIRGARRIRHEDRRLLRADPFPRAKPDDTREGIHVFHLRDPQPPDRRVIPVGEELVHVALHHAVLCADVEPHLARTNLEHAPDELAETNTLALRDLPRPRVVERTDVRLVEDLHSHEIRVPAGYLLHDAKRRRDRLVVRFLVDLEHHPIALRPAMPGRQANHGGLSSLGKTKARFARLHGAPLGPSDRSKRRLRRRAAERRGREPRANKNSQQQQHPAIVAIHGHDPFRVEWQLVFIAPVDSSIGRTLRRLRHHDLKSYTIVWMYIKPAHTRRSDKGWAEALPGGARRPDRDRPPLRVEAAYHGAACPRRTPTTGS
ncbi:hypothetical protein QHF85_03410 [Polyangium sp. 6x1]|nr:hypothetical protein [Polyangium sp. 6x1]